MTNLNNCALGAHFVILLLPFFFQTTYIHVVETYPSLTQRSQLGTLVWIRSLKHLSVHDSTAALCPWPRIFLMASCTTLSQGFFADPNKSTRTSSHSSLQWILVDYWDMIFPSRGHSALLIFSIALLQPIFLLQKSHLPGQPVPGSFGTFYKATPQYHRYYMVSMPEQL